MLSYPFRTECQTYHVSLFTPLTNATHINSLQVGKQLRKQWHALFSQWNSSYISFNNQEILSPPYNKIAPYFCTARSLTHMGCWVGTKRMLKQSAGPWGEAWMQQWSGCSTTGWCAASPGKNSAGWRLHSASPWKRHHGFIPLHPSQITLFSCTSCKVIFPGLI